MPYAVTSAQGCQVKLGDGATTEIFTEIKGVFNGPNGPTFTPIIIEAKYHSSTSIFRKVTHVDKGSVTFSIYYDSTDTQHLALIAAAAAKTRKNFQQLLTDSGAEQYAFAAYVGAQFKGEVEGFNVYDIT